MGVENSKDQFVRATLRHFDFHRASIADGGDNPVPFPDDWFDLPPSVLADFGAMMYLAALTRYHMRRNLQDIFLSFEPALRLGQYKLLYSNGFPRAFITWAGLSAAAEHKFAVDHIGLCPQDWNSGHSIWLVDLIAPFGHIDQIVPLLGSNQQANRVRTLHHNADGSRFRVVEWARAAPDDPYNVRSYGQGQFKTLLQSQSQQANGAPPNG
ncbi:MAG: toxin-activating lysine-acyltransferase [Cypionkella sp.]|nr:toxin-activating lysine-acyltransferase [Cypionkella sp.]